MVVLFFVRRRSCAPEVRRCCLEDSSCGAEGTVEDPAGSHGARHGDRCGKAGACDDLSGGS